MKFCVPQLLCTRTPRWRWSSPILGRSLLPPEGYDRPKLTPGQMEQAFANPSARPYPRPCKGKKEVAILFDDITRPTRTYEILPYVLRELDEAGITDEQIRLIAAVGTHGTHDNHALRKKLSQEYLERFLVFQHNPWENCVPVGTTSHGNPWRSTARS